MSKYCGNCGQQLEDDARFCLKCGQIQEDAESLQKEAAQINPPAENPDKQIIIDPDKQITINPDTRPAWGKRVMYCITAVIIGLLIYGFMTGAPGSGRITEDKYVTLVKNGTLELAPHSIIGKSFESFFGNGQWTSFTAKDTNKRVVEFSGQCTWNNKPARCKVQFIIKGNNNFELGAVAINDVDMNMIERLAIVKKILEGASSPNADLETKDITKDKPQNDVVPKPSAPAANAKKTGAGSRKVERGVVLDQEGLNVRSGPGTNYSVVTVAPYGSAVALSAEKNGWYKISYHSTSGWCSANYIEKIKDVNKAGFIVDGETNIRSGPGSSSKIDGVFAYHEKVYVLGEYADWYLVKRPAAGDQVVWVYSDLVKLP